MNIVYKSLLTYGLFLSAFLTTNLIFGQAPCPPTVVTVPYIGGKVFLDYGQDGAFNTGIDQPVSGVTISVYTASNTLVGTATSTADGNYIFESASMTNGARYRLEFTNGPSEYEQTFAGTDSKTSVQFATASSCNINFGLMDPVLYCQTGPRFATNRFVEGNNSGTDNTIVSIEFNAAASASESNDPSLASAEAVANVTGTTLGLAYQRSSKNLFASAYMRRFAGFGPGGTGAIYRIPNPHDGALSGGLFVNLNTLFGSSVAGTDPHNFTTETSGGDVIDENSFNQVGRVSFGDIDISDDELSLWAVNLNDRSLYRIPLGSDPANPVAPTLSSQVTVIPLASTVSPLPNLPSGVANAELRPFALKYRKGVVYIGMVTNGQSGGPLLGLVYSYNTTTSTFTKELEFSLTYNRGCGFGQNTTCYGSANWQAWLNSNVWSTPTVSGAGEAGYPQPMLTDIEFDAAGNMLLALRDRWGDQGGRNAPQPNSPYTLRTSDAFGDLLMATKNSGAGWSINMANFTDPSTASGTSEPVFGTDNYGPVSGYYHEETGMGGMAVMMRQNMLIVPVMDARTSAFTNGVDWYNLSTSGLPLSKSITLLSGAANPFGKAHGLGEVELLCDLAPLEIGNFVWFDSNLNGIQDPAETAIANVSLELYTDPNGDGNPADGTLVGTTTTNATGNYYFNTSNVNLNGANGLLPNTNYLVQIGTADWTGGAGVGDLAGYQLTSGNVGGTGQPDVRDNDATLIASRPRIPLTTGANGKTNHTFDIGFKPACNLSATGSGTNVNCNGGNNGTATVTVSGNFIPVTYLWSNGATSQNITGLVAGTYSVTVTESVDCTAVASYVVTQPPALNLSTSVTNVLCHGNATGAINLTVSGGTSPYTYNWGGGVTTEDRTGLVAGNFSVTVTDANSCTAVISATVSQPAAALSLSTGVTNVLCNGGASGAINLTVLGGTSPYNYNWGGGITTEDRSGLIAGTYTVTVTDSNGCSATTSASISEPTVLSAGTLTTPVSCNGGSNGTINLTVNGGTPGYSYNWGGGVTTEDRTGLLAGTYTVTVTDANGCTITTSATITEPTALLISCSKTDVSITNGSDGSATVNANGGTVTYSYLWSNGQTTSVINGISAGTYSVTVTDANGCSAFCSTTLTEPSCTLGLAISAEDALCNGDSNGSIDLTISGAQGSIAILWNDGATTEDRTGLTAGTYSVTVTDDGNCTASISITVNEPEALAMAGTVTDVTITNGTDGTIDIAVMGGTLPYSYLWSDGSTDEDRSNLPSGMYSVTVTDANGCTLDESFSINEPGCALSLNITAEDALCNGDANGSIDLTITGAQGSISIVWNDGATSEDRTGLTAGTYSVTVTDSGNCTATISVTVNEPDVLGMTGNVTNVTITNGSDGTISVTVTGGTLPYSYLWSDGATTEDRTGLTVGTYSVTVTDANDCADEASFTLSEPPCSLVLSVSAEDALCNGDVNGSIDLTITGAQGSVTILWNDGATSEDRTGLTAGNYSVTVTDSGNCSATISVTVNEPEVLGMTGSVTNVTITNGSDGTISVTVSGGTTPYSYLWNDGSIDEDRINLPAGTYSVTVTDANGCLLEQSFSINEPGCALELEIDAEDALCNGDANGSIDLTITGAQGSVAILWNDGATSEDRTGLTAGNYSVTVTDSGNCSATISVTVNEPEVLGMTGSVTNVTITNGSDGTISVTVSGGTTPYSYLWNDGSTDEDRINLPAGTYSVTVTDANGCSLEQSFTINEPGCALELEVDAEDALCNGDANGSIDLTITGAQGSVTILWNDGATSEDRTGLTAGNYSVTVTDSGNCSATISVTVNEPEVLGMTGSITNVTITNGSDGTISVTVSGGTSPYSYLWNDGSTDEDRINLPAGTYSVTVTDANGCSLEQSFTINEPGCALELEIDAEDALCNGDANGSINLIIMGAQGSLTFLWNDGATSEDRTGLSAGTYSVTVTDSGNCTASISVTVNEPEVLGMTGSVTNVTITNGSDGTVNITVTGGTLPYSYLWSDGATTEDRTGLSAGTYSVTVTDANGCSEEASFTLSEPPCSLELDISAEDALCNGDANGSIDLTITGAQGSVTIFWNDGATTEDRTGLTAGTYSVTVTDSGNCSATISVSVNEPEVLGMTGSITNVTITNGNDGTVSITVTGGTLPYSYLWSDGATTEDRTGLSAGTYSVTVTDANGCLDEASFTLAEPPCSLELDISAEDALCNGDANGSIDLTITGTQGSVTILWNDGATTEDRTGLTAGTYSVTVTDDGECTASISVSVNEPEVLGMTGSVTNVTITNGSDGTVSITVTGGTLPYSYLWSDGATTEDRTGLTAGTYSVTVTDANGCLEEASFTLSEPPCSLELDISAEDALCNGEANGSIDLTITGAQGSVTILWNDGATTEDRTGLSAGTYSVTVTDDGECTASISVTVNEPEVLDMTGSVTNVTITNGSDGTVSISVTGGTLPYSYLWSDGATTEDRTGLTAGTYSVTVTDANGCLEEASFTLSEPPCSLELDISAEDALCNGETNGSIDLTITGAQGSVTILWNDGATTEDRTGLSAGTYSVTVTDDGECTASISVTVNEPEPLTINADIDHVSIYGGTNGAITLTVTGGTSPYSYVWNDGVTTKDRANLIAGTYSVTVTDANNCSEEATFTITEPYCEITDAGYQVLCHDNGTPTNLSDDTFSVTFNPTGIGIGTTYNISGDIVANLVPYGANSQPFGYFPIANGNLVVNIANSASPACQLTNITIEPPEPCSYAADLSLSKSVNNSQTTIGATVTYTLTVTNEGTIDATGVEVTDVLPVGGVSYVSSTPAQGSYDENTGVWSVGTVAVGQSATITIDVLVLAAGVWLNTAEITFMNEEDIDSTPDNEDPTEDDIDRACITIPLPWCLGETFTASVPDEYENVQWYKDGVLFGTGNTIILNDVGEYTYTATNAQCPADGCCPIIIEHDSCIFDLALIKQLATGQSSTVSQGDVVNYTITVYNQGELDAKNITITDYIPVGMTLADANWSDNGDGTASYTIAGPLENGTNTTINISLQVGATFQGTSLTNVSEISEAFDGYDNPTTDVDSTPDTDPDNDTVGGNDVTDNSDDDEDDHDPETIEVYQEFDLALIKQLSGGQSSLVNQGDIVNYTLTVYNQGTLTATNVTITDYIPVGMTLSDANWTDNGDGTASYTIAGPIAQSTSTTVTIALQVGATFQGTSLTNVSEISEAYDGDGNPGDDIDSTPDTNPDNDTNGGNDVTDNSNGDEDDHDPETIEVYQEFDLALIKQLSGGQPSLVNQGDIVNYTLTVYNQGTLTATNVTITDYIPVGMTLADANWTDNGDGTASYTIAGPIAQSTSTTVTIALQVGATFQGTSLTNVSEISEAYDGDGNPGDDIDSTPDTNPDNDTNGGNDVTDNSNDDEDDHDPETIEVYQEFDLALIKQLSPGQSSLVNQGDIVNYTLTVYNQGTLTATNVTITDYIPVGMTLSDANWTDNGDGTASYTIAGPIAQSTSMTVTIALQVGATFQGTSLTNVSEISEAYDGDGNPGDDIDSTPDTNPDNDTNGGNDVTDNSNGDEDDHDPETIEVYQEFDLALIKQLSPGQSSLVNQGDIVNYTLTVYNQGTLTATNVTITDYIPVGMTLSDANWTDNGDGTASYTIAGPIAQSTSTTVTIALQVGATFQGTSLTNVSEISEAYDGDGNPGDDIDSTPDTNPDNDTNGGNDVTDNSNGDEDDHDPETIEVYQEFDLALIKQLSPGQSSLVNQGDIVNYTLTVYNQGTLTATNVTITDYIPVGMTLADANWTDNGDGTASYTIAGPIAQSTSTTVTIALQVGATFQGTSLTNVSEISEAYDGDGNPGDDIDSTPDTNPDNDTNGGNDVTDNSNGDEDDHDPETIEVYQEFDLALIKQLSGGQSSLVNQGDIVNYTLTVYNQGTLTATNVTITDYIPVGMTLADANWTDNGDGTASYTIAGPIAQSTSTTVTIALQVGATFQGTSLTNVSEISEAYDGDGNPGDDIDSTPDTNPDNDTNGGNDVTDNSNGDEDDHDPETIEVYQEFDLALIKQLSAGQSSLVNQGDIVNYTLTVYNQGTLTATNVTITDYIPVGMTLSDANWTDNGDGTASYTIAGPIAQSTSTTVTIALQVGATFQGTSLTNVSEISEAYDGDGNPGDDIDSTPDTNPDNDTNGGNDVTDNSNGDEDDHDPETIEVYQEFDLALIKQLSPGQPSLVNQGDIVNYTLTVYNQGTLTATNVTITDYIPVGMTLSDANWTDNGDGTASYTIAGPIAQSTSTTVTIALQVGATFQGTSLTNVSEISEAYDGDGNPGDDIDSTPDTNPDNDTNGGNDVTDNGNGDEDDHDPETIEVHQEFDLALIKQLSGGQPSLVNQGDIVNYTLTVYNQGTLTATNVTITDYIPVGMTLSDANWTDNGDGTASYTIAGPIAQSTSTTVTIALQIGATFQGTSLTNVSEISEAYDGDGNPGDDIDSTPDTNPDNDTNGGNDVTDNSNGDEDDHDPETIEVYQEFDLALIKQLSGGQPSVVNQGDIVNFTITIFNQGTLDAYNVAVVDYIPDGMDLVDSNWSPGTGNTANYNTLLSIPAGESVSINIALQVFDTFEGASLSNYAEVSGADNIPDYPDIDSTPDSEQGNDIVGGDNVIDNSNEDEDDHDYASVGVNQTFDLALIKTLANGQPSTVSLGDDVEFTITVFNQGTLTATNVQINDYLLGSMTLNDSDWSMVSGTIAHLNTPISEIAPGDSYSVNITLTVNSNFQFNVATNRAEIASADNALGLPDIDSTPDDVWDNDLFGGDNITDNTNGDEDDSDPAPVNVLQTFDLALIKQLSPGQVTTTAQGETVNFSITIFNQGTLDAFNVVITDYFPDGFELTDAAWTLTGANSATYNTPVTVPVGQSVVINIALRVSDTFEGNQLINFAEISDAENGLNYPDVDSTPDTDPLNDTIGGDDIVDNTNNDQDDHDYATIEVYQEFDLALIKQLADGQSDEVAQGETATFTITVFNQGTLSATLVAITDYIPEGMILADANWTDNGNGTASYVLPDLIAPGNSAQVNITLMVEDGFEGITVTNFAEISGAKDGQGTDVVDIDSSPDTYLQNDIVGGDNIIDNTNNDEDDHDFAPIGIIQVFDLALIKQLANGQASTVALGETITFTITVFNQGTLTANNTTLTDYIPAGTTLADSDWTNNGNGTASYTLPGSIAPGATATADITLMVNPSFTGGDLTNYAEISNADNTVDYPDEDSTHDTNPNNDIEGGNDVTDNSNGDEDDHDGEAFTVCNIALVTINTLCDDNGTGASADDLFTFTISPSGIGLSGTYGIVGDVNASGLDYSIEQQFGPFAISNGDLNFVIADEATGGCIRTSYVVAPEPCSTCAINGVSVQINCTDNTTGNPADDLFTFTLNPFGIGLGGSYSLTGDVVAQGVAYGSESNPFGPYDISGGDLSITITDDAESTCALNVVVEAPLPCSTCAIVQANEGVYCDDNNTGASSDDLFYFTLNPVGVGLASTYNISGATTATGLAYGTPQVFGPFPISGGDLTITITDGIVGGCTHTLTIFAPEPCSTCTLEDADLMVYCNDNGTGTSSDDLFYITLNPTGTGLGATYNISGDITATGIAYGLSNTFGLYPISGGILNITLTDSAAAEDGCSLDLEVTPPDPCSTCELSGANATVQCDDNNTGTPSDDVFYITLNPDGIGLGSTYSLSGDVIATGVAYGSPQEFGPFPISGGNLNITLTDNAAAADGCTLDFLVTAPAPCSTCSIESANIEVQCDDNNTGISTDDMYYFTMAPTGSGLSSTYHISGSFTAANVPYGNVQMFGPFAISDGDLSITITDNDVNGCTFEVIVTAPEPCSIPVYDLALVKTLAPGQTGSVISGAPVNFALTVYNQGDVPVQNILLIEYIPEGLILNDPDWSDNGNGTASFTMFEILNPGQSASVQISFTTSVQTPTIVVNRAEITAAEDMQGNPIVDEDSNFDTDPDNDTVGGNNFINNENNDEDDHDYENINVMVPPCNLGNFVWHDLNQNGVQDPGEPGIHNVLVSLYTADGWLAATQYTNVAGSYLFVDLAPGSYYVVFSTPSDASGTLMIPTLHNVGDDYLDSDADPVTGQTQTVTLVPGETNLSIDAGYYMEEPPILLGSIGDFVWLDQNQNGQQNAGEPGISGVWVTLYNASTNSIVSITTTDINGYYLFSDLPAGNYYVVFGTPTGHTPSPANSGNDATDSDAGPGGQTSVIVLAPGENNLTVDAGFYIETPPVLLGSLGDYVWLDQNQNGQQDSGEQGIAGVAVTLYNAATNTFVSTTVTNANGFYLFSNLPAGNYYVVFGTPTGHTPSPANSGNDATDSDAGTGGQTSVIVLAPGENNLTIDAGFFIDTPPNLASLGDFVWLDANENGQQDVGEQGISGVAVTLYNAATNTFVSTTVTNANGFYLFSNLPAGNYYVVFGTPTGHTASPTNVGNDATDSNAGIGGQTTVITLAPGENNLTIDAGFYIDGPPALLGSIGDYVWFDQNQNGQQNSGEPGIGGVTVMLFNAATNTVIATTTTNPSGYYLFNNLVAGSYYVVFVTPLGYSSAPANTGNDATDSDALTGGQTNVINLAPGENNLTIDAGFTLPGAISGTLWVDLNQNNTINPTEPLLSGVTVVLIDNNGNVIATTVTDVNGFYQFTGLVPGNYTVQVPQVVPTPTGNVILNTPNNLTVTVIAGQTSTNNNFGYIPPAVLSDVVWLDINGNCILETNEEGLAGIELIVYNSLGQQVATVVTGVNGSFTINNLPAGIYTVTVVATTLPDGTQISQGSITYDMATGEVLFAENFCVTEDDTITPCTHPDLFLCTEPMTPLTICPEFCLPDGWTFSSVQTTYNCSLVMLDDCIQYTPLPLFAGTDVITIVACYNGVCETQIVHVTVGDCTPPPCESFVLDICTAPMTPVVVCPEFCLSGSYQITQTSTMYNCSIQFLSNGCLQYTALPGFIGSDMIQVIACNEALECDTAIINITVTSNGICGEPNQPPVAVDDEADVENGSSVTIPVLVNDYDPDGDAFSITTHTPPANGTVSLVGNQFIYTPNEGFEGTDVFTYQICDTEGACDMATVTIDVIIPCTEVTMICTQPLTPIVICPEFCNIPNGTITIIQANTTYNCSLYSLGGGCLQYTALPLFAGQETITITGCNQFGVCETITITVNVTEDCDEVGMAPYNDNTNPDNADQKVLIGTDNGALLVNLALLEMKPVPATDYLDIMFNTVKGAVLMEVTDLSGRVIFSQQLNATEGINNYRLPVFDYATGIYLVSLKSGEAKVSGKFVKH